MMILKLSILCCAITTIFCGVSDPLGLNARTEFKFSFGANEDYVKGSVWPTPQQEVKGKMHYTLDPKDFYFSSSGEQSDVLIEALTRYKLLTFPDNTIKVDKKMHLMKQLNVHVEKSYQPMDLNTDESYTLVVAAPISSLAAQTVWGALRGLETFSQVVHQNITTGCYNAQENKIVDSPRFAHRGFLIDTSRHFVSVKIIYQFIDALAYSKFNVLHWHIVDDQAFPYVSKHFPIMSEKGARGKKSVYSPTDVKNIIDYGRYRGVRILPEFDTPGHTVSWGSIENLLTPCYSGSSPNGYYGPINPTLESTYVFLKEFFSEVAQTFPDPFIHLGGDEVSFSCWKSNPNIAKWMADNGMGKNYSLLEEYYEKRLLDIVGKLGKNYVIWQEVVDNKVKVKADTVVNVWRGGWQSEMARVTKMGYHTILSSCWYLNYISYGLDWPNYYKCDPQDFTGTAEQMKLVIGGTACMWGEWVDGVNLISRTWARGLAVGGRLWSAKDVRNVNDAALRMWEHRCRYLMRGLAADSVVQSQYCRHEWQNE